jgi:ubiquinone/menaquinone biosynthesis C-methylase UbiE
MTSLRRQLGAQASKPSGIAGVVAAALMLVAGPSGCYHEAVAGRLDVQPDDVLLDVACGSALFLRRYAGRARRVAGLDHSPVQVGLACHVLRRRIDAGTAEVVAGDAAAMPWAEGTFTAVTCNCLSCIGEGEQALAEMYRVLRPGGRIVVATDFRADPDSIRREERDWGWRGWTMAELQRALQRTGFIQIGVTHDADATLATAVKPR